MSKKDVVNDYDFLDAAGNHCIRRSNGTLRVISANNQPSMTIQSEKDFCDINKIVSRFKTTGLMTNLAKGLPQQGDFTQVTDYHSALNQVIAAQDAFMALPAAVRKRFANDPGQLLSFVEDPQNRAEAIQLGLITSSQASEVPQEEVIPPSKEGG